MKFRRAMLIEPYKFDIFEVDEEPGPGQVLLKITGCGLCNWEVGFFRGELNFQGYPHKLGHEFSGEVVALGPGCSKLKIGDKVSALDRGFGGFAEYRVTSELVCEKLEDHIDPRYAMGEPQKCVVTVIRATKPEFGDYGVVQGCGPMGMWCIQGMAGNLLAGLIAVDIDDEKLAMAKNFGATHTINSKTENVVEKIKEITKGHMADFVIEGTGVPALLDSAQDMLKAGRGSRLVLMSSHHGVCKEFDFRKAVDRGLQIIAAHPPFSENDKDDFERAVNMINKGIFKNEEIITHEFSLDEIQKAFETLNQKPADFMKGIVLPQKK